MNKESKEIINKSKEETMRVLRKFFKWTKIPFAIIKILAYFFLATMLEAQGRSFWSLIFCLMVVMTFLGAFLKPIMLWRFKKQEKSESEKKE